MKAPEIAAVARIARRTARRNWKRTALIVAIIAIPVAASQLTAGMIAAGQISDAEYATQQLGAADVVVQGFAPTEQSMGWVERQVAELAQGADVLRFRNAYGAIPDATEYVEVTDLDVTAPLARGKLGLVAGAVPDEPGEVALSDLLLTLTGAGIGDEVTIALEGLEAPFTVVGTVRDVLYRNRSVAIISASDMDTVYANASNSLEFVGRDANWLIATADPDGLLGALSQRWETARSEFRPLPVSPRPEVLTFLDDDLYASLNADQVAALAVYAESSMPGEAANPDYVPGDAASQEALYAFQDALYREAWRVLGGYPAIYPEVGGSTAMNYTGFESGASRVLQAPAVLGTLLGALLLAEVALVAGAAYATGIRRRLRELGLLAVNGATSQHLRWIVVGEGVVAGLLGAGLGSLIGLVLMNAGRATVQRFVERFIIGSPLGVAELLAPALVGVAAATLAAWVPARSASRVPAITALQGRMPLSHPRRWVVPSGIAITGFGAFLVIVARTALGSSGVVQAGLGVALMIGGFALLTGPIVAWVGTHADRFPAVTRLVIRDSARQRTRAATAIAATMVVLVAPIVAGAAIRTDQVRNLNYGLAENPAHVLVAGESAYTMPPHSDVDPADVSAVAQVLPASQYTEFAVYGEAAVGRIVRDGVVDASRGPGVDPDEMLTAAGSSELLALLGVAEAAADLDAGRAVILGVERRDVELRIGEHTVDAVEVPAHVMRYQFPRILVGERLAAELGLGESHTVALFVNDRPLTEKERLLVDESGTARSVWGERITPNQMMVVAGGATLLVVLLIIALVTALAATESDHDIRTMVAVGAPPRIRRRFLGIQTAYYTLFAAILATPLAMLLMNVASGDSFVDVGPFGALPTNTIVTPWLMIGLVVVAIPLAVGAVTALAARSAPTVPPRRIG